MKTLRNNQKRIILLALSTMVVLLALGIMTQVAQAKSACDVADEYGGHSGFWNFLCFVERMFDYLFRGDPEPMP